MNTRRVVIAGLPRYVLESVAFGGMLALLLIMLGATGSIAKVLPVASLFAFAGYRLMPALSQIFVAMAQIRSSTASLDVVVADLVGAEAEEATDRDAPPLPLRERLVLDGVAFRYAGSGREVLKGIDLTIERGEAIALVGPTGAGKTTLVDILLGLLEPTAGAMRVDGTVVDRRTVRGWQQQLGYVPQHIFLSDDTIARNITLGSATAEVDRERIAHAAALAGLAEFIAELPEGYETRVGERGVRLSGGQIQRLGIARAIYRDPPLLFFDEATSALDAHTERGSWTGSGPRPPTGR